MRTLAGFLLLLCCLLAYGQTQDTDRVRSFERTEKREDCDSFQPLRQHPQGDLHAHTGYSFDFLYLQSAKFALGCLSLRKTCRWSTLQCQNAGVTLWPLTFQHRQRMRLSLSRTTALGVMYTGNAVSTPIRSHFTTPLVRSAPGPHLSGINLRTSNSGYRVL